MKTLANRDFCKKKLDTRFDTHCIKTGVQLWRRVRDSNPRWVAPHSISSAAPSTTRTTLHNIALICYKIFLGLSTKRKTLPRCYKEKHFHGAVSGGTMEKSIFSPVSGCAKQSRWDQRAICSQPSSTPYFLSPTRGNPLEENCTRI